MGNRLSKIVTRTGDAGTTGLGDGSRVSKDSARIEAIGAVDELNSTIGWFATAPGLPAEVSRLLLSIQHDLFDLGGELAVPGYSVLTDARVATLTMTMVSPALPAVPQWLDALHTLPGMADAVAGTITATDTGGYTVLVTMHIDSDAFSGRFTDITGGN